jgi:hypothetical protein
VSRFRVAWALVVGALAAGCAGAARRAEPSATATPAPDDVEIGGERIASARVERFVQQSGQPREAALADLADLVRVLRAAKGAGLTSGSPEMAPAERARLEHALALKLALEVPKAEVSLIVDHAWLKDAPSKAERDRGRKQLERLRGLVEHGATIPAAFQELKLPGALWHIGDHETYAYDIVPEDAHDLPPGSLSPIIAGDGGLHLFKIYERRETPPPADAVRAALRDKLAAQ